MQPRGNIPFSIWSKISCNTIGLAFCITNCRPVDTLTYELDKAPIINKPKILAPVIILLIIPDFINFITESFPNLYPNLKHHIPIPMQIIGIRNGINAPNVLPCRAKVQAKARIIGFNVP